MNRVLDIGVAVVVGVASIPIGLFYGTRRTIEDVGLLGKDLQREDFAESKRIWGLMKAAIENRGIIMSVITIVVFDCIARLPQSTVDKLAEHLVLRGFMMVAKSDTRKFIRKTVANIVVTRIGPKIVTNVMVRQVAGKIASGAPTPLAIQGTIGQASNASQRPRRANPRLWKTLADQNLDMLHGFVEDELAPFVALAGIIDSSDPRCRRAFAKFESEVPRHSLQGCPVRDLCRRRLHLRLHRLQPDGRPRLLDACAPVGRRPGTRRLRLALRPRPATLTPPGRASHLRSLWPRSRPGSSRSRTRCFSTFASGKPPSALRSQIRSPS